MKLFIIISFIPLILFAFTKTISDSLNKVNKPSISMFKVNSEDAQKLTRIKMAEAILIAQSKSSGKLIESSLETENNLLVYSISFLEFDKSISEITVDAGTGNILNIEKQSMNNL